MTSGRWGRTLRAGLVAGTALVAAGMASGVRAEGRNPMKLSEAQYEPAMYSDIVGWAEDDHDAAFASFRNSCKALLRKSADALDGRPMQAALQKICRKVADVDTGKLGAARAFFENNFSPIKIAPLGAPDGFLTGYYEPIVEGVTEPTKGYDWPLYRKPASLLTGGRMAVAGAAVG